MLNCAFGYFDIHSKWGESARRRAVDNGKISLNQSQPIGAKATSNCCCSTLCGEIALGIILVIIGGLFIGGAIPTAGLTGKIIGAVMVVGGSLEILCTPVVTTVFWLYNHPG